MKKAKILLSALIVICLFFSVFVGCSSSVGINNDTQYGGVVPQTDLASEYKGQATDKDGNLLAPFDVVYPEAFESGDYKYDKTAALLKFAKGFDGKITKDLKSCGFASLEK